MNFFETIKDGRERMGMTLSEAAESIGISLTYLCDIEKARPKKISMEFIYAAANTYGLSVDELCVLAKRIPRDVYYKIANNPQLFQVIRNIEV
jgi:transcriptional regulator with XRE-family HTH domain